MQYHSASALNLTTISSTISLFFQSSFHLSLTVLVRYRSLDFIQPLMMFTTNFELQSQTTRLHELLVSYGAISHRVFTFYDLTFQSNSILFHFTSSLHTTTHFTVIEAWAFPTSLAVTKGIIVIFFSSAQLDASIQQVFLLDLRFNIRRRWCFMNRRRTIFFSF